MRRLRNKARRRTTRSASSFVCSSYARRLRAEQLEDRRMLATFAVTNLDDAGAGSLREAIAMASTAPGADTIEFASGVGEAFENGGVIRLSSQLDISDANELTIDGSTAGGEVIITGDAGNDDAKVGATEITDAVNNTMTSDNVRVFNITNGTVNLNSLTITGGVSSDSSPDVDDGGGIRVGDPSVTINVTASNISGNRAIGAFAYGGGISNVGTATFADSTVSGNRSEAAGGGLHNSTNDSLTLINAIVSDNYSDTSGGGIDNLGTATLLGVTLSGNAAAAFGGGINNSTNDTATLTNVTFVGNSANQGGAVSNFGTATLTNNTLTGNSGVTDSGGIYTDTGDTTNLRNSIVLGNNATAGSAETGGSGTLNVANSLTSGTATDIFTNTQTVGGVVAGMLDDHGGSLQTVALVRSSSNPAIDAGDATQLVEATVGLDLNNDGDTDDSITSDARGLARLVDLDGVGTTEVDLGAFELQAELPSLIVTTTDDEMDNGDFVTSLREAIVFANSKPGADTITFASGVGEAFQNGGVIRLSSQLFIHDIGGLTIDGSTAGGEVIITGDTADNDATIGLTAITDAINNTNTTDNVRVFNVSDGTVDLRHLTITGGVVAGSSSAGGGVLVGNADVTLTNSIVSGNRSNTYGGGISVSSGAVTLTGSTVDGNRTGALSAAGGGVFADTGAVILSSSTVSNNQTDGIGGGIFSLFGNVTVANSTVSGNSAAANVGGVGTLTGSIIVTNSTITSNDTTGAIGGIVVDDSSVNPPLTIQNSLVAGNTSTGTTPDLAFDPDGAIDIDYTLVGDAAGLTITGNGNLLGDSAGSGIIDPLLGPLADNGGPTQTHALLTGSPAVNSGDPSFVSPPDFDQRGAGFQRSIGSQIDMGAFEHMDSPSLIVTTSSDVVDNTDFVTSLREAIAFANSQAGADTITFDTGLSGQTITLSGAELEITDSLTIDASLLAENVTVDANQQSRVLNFSASTGSLTLNALNITGGNTSSDGGGIHTLGSALMIINSTVSGNSSEDGGGGIFAYKGAVTLTNSTVSGNSSDDGGGGIFAYKGAVTLTNSTVSGNSSDDGGGIYSMDGAVTLTNSTVNANSSGQRGGGIYTFAGAVTLTNSTVSGNSSTKGGGIFSYSSAKTLTNSTITLNTASGTVGGIGNFDVITETSLIVRNSIISGNTDNGTAPDFRAPSNPGSNLSVRFSLIGNNTGTSLAGAQTADADGNLIGTSVIPINPLLGPLADNGGPTRTHALLPGSPAIDVGNSALLPDDTNDLDGDNDTAEPVPFDQRGTGFPRQLNGQVDIGAFEGVFDQPAVFFLPKEVVATVGTPLGLDLSNAFLVDGSGTGLSLVFEVSAGLLAASSGVGVTVDGSGTNSVTLAGSASDLNTFLDTPANLQYTPAPGVLGDNTATITVSVSDGTTTLPDETINVDIIEQASLLVSTTADVVSMFDGETSLREAIALANSQAGADTITFASGAGEAFEAGGVMRLTDGTTLELSRDITINGTVPNGSIVISGDVASNDTLVTGTFHTDIDQTIAQGNHGDNIRVFNITAGTANLNSLTITGGRRGATTADDGGGILVGNASVTLNLTNSTVVGNSARFGAGVNNRGTTTITDTTISGNRASSGGGGISNSTNDMLTVTGSTITGNTAGTNGGGIVNYGTTEIINSTVSSNTAVDDGGGVSNSTNDMLTLTGSMIIGNTATDDGGGIANFGITEINTSTVLNNISGNNGGGIAGISSDLTLTNSTVSGNNATTNGGGISARSSYLTLANSTISGNASNSQGGGIYAEYGSLTLANALVASNTSASGSDILVATPLSTPLNVNYSLIGDSSGTSLTPAPVASPDANGNLIGTAANPINPLLAHLADNGGPTMTHALLPGSPAFNAGDPSFASPPDFDQRGSGFDRIQLGRIDIGAFEAQTLIVNDADGGDDGDLGNGVTTLREAVNVANSIAGADTITFAAALSGQTIALGGTELSVTDSLSIDASSLAGGITVDGSDTSRLFNFTATTGDLSFNGLNFTGGAVNGNGGAVRFDSVNTLSITNSTLHGNKALGASGDDGDGGAIFTTLGDINLVNSTLSGNIATDDGAGIRTISGAVTIDHSTITANTADDAGGGISRLNGAGVTIRNSIVAQNIANGSDPDLDASGSPNVMFSLIGDNTGTSLTAAPLGSPDANGNLIGTAALPIDPLLDPLTDNGGKTSTHALQQTSPGLDSGDPTFAVPPNFDQRGEGFDRVSGGRIDMGAFERVAPSADFDSDGDIDGSDFLAWQRGFGTSTGATRADGDADNDGDVDASDLVVWQATYGQLLDGLAAASSGQSAITSGQEATGSVAESALSAALVDAAIAFDLTNESAPGAAALFAEESYFTTEGDRAVTANSAAVNASINRSKSVSVPSETDESDQGESPWLSDELLEAVFS